MSDAYWIGKRKMDAVQAAENKGEVADSLDVRTELLRRVSVGEITLAEAKVELEKIKRVARSRGLKTRNATYTNG